MGSVFIDPSSLPSTAYGNVQLAELFIVYAYLLYIGCTLISDGAELLMLTPYSKVVGSCILPILGAVPDGAIVLFSGLGNNAQSSLDVGVGALAGSTVMLITVPWALAIYGGLVNIDDATGLPKYAVPRGQPRLDPANNYWRSGVSVGSGYGVVLAMSLWMLFTSLPYFVVEIGALVAESKHGGIANQQDVDDDRAETLALQESPAVLVALLMSIGSFFAYLAYQYRQAYAPDIETLALDERTRAATVNTVKNTGVGLVAAIKPVLKAHKRQVAAAAAAASSPSGGTEHVPLVAEGELSRSEDVMLRAVIKPFFRRYDVDNSNTLSVSELGRVFEDMNEPKSEAELRELFAQYDSDRNGQLSFDEFCEGMMKYVQQKDPTEDRRERRGSDRSYKPLASTVSEGDAEEMPVAEPVDEEEDEEEEEVPDEFAESKFRSVAEQQRAIQHSALFKCFVGTAVVLAFSDPITDVLDEVGSRTGISAFYVGFVVAPLITNGSELLASYTFALKKTQRSMVVAYEQLLGAAVMNNTYCLSIFCILIYAQDLYWNYTAEVLAIIAAELVVFAIVTSFHVHTLKTAAAVLSLYPFTLLLVYILETFVGLS